MKKEEIPPRKELIQHLEEAGNTKRLIDHSNMVADCALRIADVLISKGIEVNKKVLEAGAILHDISFEKHHGPDHGMIGHDIILELGLPEAAARLAEIHEPWSKEECEALKIAPKYCRDHFPENWEEKIFIAADSIPFMAIFMGIDPWTSEPDMMIEVVLPYWNDDYWIPITGGQIDKTHPFFMRWLQPTLEILKMYSQSDFEEFRKELEAKYEPEYLKEVAL